MKIRIGQFTKNRTNNYLRTLLRTFGQDFKNKFEATFKVAYGVGDFTFVKNGVEYDQHLFVLFDTKIFPVQFIDWLEFIRDEEYYETDYVFDDITKGRLHMVVLRLPDSIQDCLHHFYQGRYSKMYDLEQIPHFFPEDTENKKIVIKDNDYKNEFVNHINEIFNSTVHPSEYEGELDFKPDIKDEMFNL